MCRFGAWERVNCDDVEEEGVVETCRVLRQAWPEGELLNVMMSGGQIGQGRPLNIVLSFFVF